jgi:hypothetical protein
VTDLATIAAARAKGLAAEADALTLADRLVAAKADRGRLRAAWRISRRASPRCSGRSRRPRPA